MILELHVWGPAFGLPSIDAQCLAAIAYLQRAVPRGQWQLVASSDPGLSPTNELPALRSGDIWIGGFRNIFHFIAQVSAGEWVLDAGLPEEAGADVIAFSSFLESHGQPLLDLSLYVSSQNYSAITRPIYNTIQSYPLPYLTPPSIRARAKQRTAHMGLSSLDIDTEDGEKPPEHSIIPESLRRPKITVSSLLASSPETNAQIRLDSLATGFLQPLQDLKGKREFFVSDDQFSSLDCLALGYLSLMLVPELPQSWLARALRQKSPELCAWTEELRETVFGQSVSVEDAFTTQAARSRSKDLPWKVPNNAGIIGVGAVFLSSMADSIPVVGPLRRNTRMQQHGGKTSDDDTKSSSWQSITAVGSIIAGVGLIIGYMFDHGVLSLSTTQAVGKERQNTGLGSFGEAGAALSVYANQMDAEVQRQMLQEANYIHGVPVAEVGIEVGRNVD